MIKIASWHTYRRHYVSKIASFAIFLSVLSMTESAVASSPVSWTKLDFICNCTSIATSSDGSKVIAGDDSGATGGHIYTSSNFGATWTSHATNQVWSAIASSSDGTKLVATVKEGLIYTSTDSGATWTSRASVHRWDSVASSSDGTKLVAGIEGGTLFTSSDSGMTWVARDSVRNWTAVASSTDGSRLVAVARGDQIFTSTDSGATWIPRETARLWRSVASSADGTKIAAAVYSSSTDSYIYTSSDSGASWTIRANDATRYWQSISMSSDGSKLVASSYMGTVYTSNDFGVSWVSGNSIQNGTAVASSADGNVFYVAGTVGAIMYTTATISKPKVTPTPTSVATPSQTPKVTPQPSNSATTSAKKITVTSKKISTKLYTLTLRFGTPNSRYTIIASKKGKNTYEYGGYTDLKGNATINVGADLAGYIIVGRMGYK